MNTRNDSLYFSISSERYTPFLLAKKLSAKALLESASFLKGKERYSILMCEDAFHIVQEDANVFFVIDGKKTPFTQENAHRPIAPGSKVPHKTDILDALQYIANQNDLNGEIPVPSSGIGYLGYEFCTRCDTITLFTQTDELNIPESEFIACHIYIVFDHFTEQLHVYALNYNEHQIDLHAAVEKLKKRLTDMDFSYLDSLEEKKECRIISDEKQSKVDYINKVNEIKKHIVKGNLLQAVPSRRMQIECENSAIEIYRRLRAVNPSPYLFYIDFGERQLVGASPESLIRVRNKIASIRPIAGTRRRGKSNAEDELLRKELLADAKENAEHLMLTDLARNDLNRVCKNGSVKVNRFMDVELFSHVMHIVSEVEGEIALDGINVLRASFPAGTVSGAPKIKAIEIISNLEKMKRRFYAGAIGYIQSNGDLDFCIGIRCALNQKNLWTLQAGGGIVHDSNPEREWEETNEKLGAMRAVLENSVD